MFSNAVSRWAGWVLAHPEFGSSVNPKEGGDYAHHITACPPGFENLTVSLLKVHKRVVSSRFEFLAAHPKIVAKILVFLYQKSIKPLLFFFMF